MNIQSMRGPIQEIDQQIFGLRSDLAKIVRQRARLKIGVKLWYKIANEPPERLSIILKKTHRLTEDLCPKTK
jgi:hypothetical protein